MVLSATDCNGNPVKVECTPSGKLTFIDEFILQRYLNDIEINFGMWNDDPFPVNTEQLKNYIT